MASEDTATEGQVKRLYAALKSVGIDYREFEKEHDISLYEPGNKPSRGQCSQWIEEIEELEAEKQAEKEHDIKTGVQKQFRHEQEIPMESEVDLRVEQEADREAEPRDRAESTGIMQGLIEDMRVAVRAAVDITLSEIEGKVEVQGLAGVVQKIAVTIFLAKYRLEEEGNPAII